MTMPPTPATLPWVARIGLSAVFLFSLVVFWAALAMQSCTERSAMASRQHALQLAAAEPVTISSDAADRRNDGRLVHVTGRLALTEPLRDEELGIAADALVLERSVEVYDGGEGAVRTDASPESDWRRRRRRSPTPRPSMAAWRLLPVPPDWRDPDPGTPTRPNSARFVAGAARLRLGAFRFGNMELPRALTGDTQPLPLSPAMLQGLAEPLRARARIFGQQIWVGQPSAPAIGDLRISYRIAAPQDVTVVAGQDYWGLRPYTMPDGKSVFVMVAGRRPAREVLAAAASEAWTAGAHVFSVPLFLFATFLIYWPLRALRRPLPAAGLLVDAGVFAFVPLVTLAATLGGVAYARWAQGSSGIGLLVMVSVAALVTLVFIGVRRREARVDLPESDEAWYYVDENGAAAGPTSLDFLRRAMSAGASRETLVWSPWTQGWVPAVEVPALASAAYWSERRAEQGPSFAKSYFLWPVVLVEEAVKISRGMEGKRVLTRSQYFDATIIAVVAAVLLLAGAVAVLDEGAPPGEERVLVGVSIALALLGLVLPSMFMVRATAARLRALGEPERRALLMLVPGMNLALWIRVMTVEGAVDRTQSPPPLRPPG